MTVITGTVEDIGMEPLSGVLVATSVEFRTSGDIIIAPESRTYPIAGGIVSADLIPGPTRITIQVGSHARDSFDVIVPDEPVTLARLIEDAFEWSPSVVSEVAAHRAAAEAAAARAEDAADDVDAAIAGAADQVVAAVEADRVAAEQAASAAAGSASAASGSASAAAGSESAAATSAAVASTQATLAGERADDAGVARDAASGSAAAAAGSASAAASSASDAAGSATGADAARAAAVVARTGAETARSGAEDARDAADGHATRAETAADSFDLTATATTGAAGSNAAVIVTGDGPAYGLSFTVPRGDKGETGDTGPKGDTGDIGPKGDKGDTGERGLQGEQGLQGIQGEQGPRGLQGDKGDKGDTGPKGDRGDDGEVSQAMLDAAVASLVDGAPEALDTLTELATALGNDPNFATTVSTEIGKRALIDGAPAAYNTLGKLVTALQNHELGGSTDASLLTGALTDQVDVSAAEVEFLDPVDGQPLTWPLSAILRNHHSVVVTFPDFSNNVGQALESKSDVGHTHTKAQVGLGNVDNTSDANKPVSTAVQAALSPLQARVGAAPATWRWNGTTLPTSAAQVHAQARVGDFIVAPNLTTDPGWHQITGV